MKVEAICRQGDFKMSFQEVDPSCDKNIFVIITIILVTMFTLLVFSLALLV